MSKDTADNVPYLWRDYMSDAKAPACHKFVARGPHGWGVGESRREAYTNCTTQTEKKWWHLIIVQCLHESTTIRGFDGYAEWSGEHDPAICPHCETSEKARAEVTCPWCLDVIADSPCERCHNTRKVTAAVASHFERS